MKCSQFIADPCGSSKCVGCGLRRKEHRLVLKASPEVMEKMLNNLGKALTNDRKKIFK